VQVTTLDPSTPEAQAVIESRRRTGADRFDEVWEGVYHVNSAPRTTHQFLVFELASAFHPLERARGLVAFDGINIGTADNFRIPDVVILREFADAVYVASAALVVEILSPGDDTWAKMPYYADRGVEEAAVLDPGKRTLQWFRNDAGTWADTDRSDLLGVDPALVLGQIDWPPA